MLSELTLCGNVQKLIVQYRLTHDIATLKGKVDTGAQGNVLPLRTYAAIYPDDLDKKGLPRSTSFSRARLIAYNGTEIPQYGTIPLRCRYQDDEWLEVDFFVADTPGPVIIGFRMSEDLGIIQMNCAIFSEIKTASSLQTNHPFVQLMTCRNGTQTDSRELGNSPASKN